MVFLVIFPKLFTGYFKRTTSQKISFVGQRRRLYSFSFSYTFSFSFSLKCVTTSAKHFLRIYYSRWAPADRKVLQP